MHADVLELVRSALADKYVLGEELGRGGMAHVYRARDLRNDRDVAIKLLPPELTRAHGGERFLLEIRTLARLSHPHILPLLDSGLVTTAPKESVPWYAMPLVAEETLRTRLARQGPLPLPVALRYTRDLCAALGYAHSQGCIHRDIKPENILIRDDQVLLADFGIARVERIAGDTTLSSAGIAIGTPAYMSPEQSLGSDKVDGRSDLYSLAVVLYEMLAGHPPFSGNSPQAISARHQFEPPPPIGIVRPGLPSAVEALLKKALAKVPADRFQDAAEFERALDQAKQGAPAAAPSRAIHRSPWWRAVAVLGIAAAIWAGVRRETTVTGLDPARYIVLPFKAERSGDAALLSSDECRELVADAIERWTDLEVVSSLTVNSLLEQSRNPLNLARAIDLTRSLGAGHFLWGEVTQAGDTLRVRGVLYDAATGREERSHTIRFAAASRNAQLLSTQFADLAYALVLPGTAHPEATADAMGTTSLTAYRLYVSGDSALAQWDLASAKASLLASLKLDPDYPNANLKLAQVGLWTGQPAEQWRGYAARAAAASGRLRETDTPMANGLLALADQHYPEACEQFSQLIARDSSDFRGWYGLAECTVKDRAVLKDPKSPSGWRFRSSRELAMNAYARALEGVPLSHRAFGGLVIDRLASRLATESNQIRMGRGIADTIGFLAFPALDHDTLAFVPYPTESFTRGSGSFTTSGAAVARNRAILHRITSGWLRDFPESAPALVAEALVRELEGDIDQQSGRSAAGLLREARRVSPDSARFPLSVIEARVRLKSGDFRGTKLLADSLLTADSNPSPAEATQLTGLALLTGRIDRSAQFAGLAAPEATFFSMRGEDLRVPLSVRESGMRLLAYASFGAPADSIRVHYRRVRDGVKASVGSGQQQDVLNAVLDQPALLGFPIIPLPEGVQNRNAFLLAADRHDLSAVRAFMRWLRQLRLGEAAGAVGIDGTFLEARMQLVVGDTAGAIESLDGSLNSLQFLGSDLIDQPQQAAAIGRAMALRAKLAAAQGDTLTAKKWGDAVKTLWADGDAAAKAELP